MGPLRPTIALTTGEPAGIGPDLASQIQVPDGRAHVVLIGDGNLLAERARLTGHPFDVKPYASKVMDESGLSLLDIPLARRAEPGHLDPENAPYVLTLIDRALTGLRSGEFDALVTAPVHKAHLNASGIPFLGHTEYLAEKTGIPHPVMLFVTPTFRVALVTTHIALKDVPAALTSANLRATIEVLVHDLRGRYGLSDPAIGVLGLNPHAGEGGWFGNEEAAVITPVIRELNSRGLRVSGPWPADTAFIPESVQTQDAWVSLYHDQALPVVKHAYFDSAVNVTLGLPFLRTSVDHGTALDLAGTGRARVQPLQAALEHAIRYGQGG
ncbi:MAG: 4-hydroxythreonine-4-phosphate dehydrogenase PdxA [Gammaproteobacteria bacterium]